MKKSWMVVLLIGLMVLPAAAFWGWGEESLKVTADTWIYAFRPTRNYGDGKGWADITDPTKSVTVPKMFLGFGGSDIKIVLLKFDTAKLKKDKAVKSAYVNIYNDYAGSAAALKVDAKMITSPWEEMKVTYRTAPRTASEVLSTVTLQGSISDAKSGKWYKFDVTKAVKAWQKGTPNYGIMLIPQGEAGVDFDLVAREYKAMAQYAPSLKISY